MTGPLVSIALGVYNGEKYLAEQLESILGQTYPNLEVTAIDDASTDKSVSILEAYARKDKRLKVCRNAQNVGLVANFVAALGHASGDYTAFSDQDDVWEKDKIETLLNVLETEQNCVLAYSDLEICDETLTKPGGSFWKASRVKPFKGYLEERALVKNLAPGCSMLFRKDVRELIVTLNAQAPIVDKGKKLDDVPVMHDHLAWIVAAGRGRVAFSPRKLVRYRQHGANSIGAFYAAPSSPESFARRFEERLEVLKPIEKELKCINWNAAREFVALYRGPRKQALPNYEKLFIWMRDANWRDNSLAIFDCYAPNFYRGLKGKK